MAPTRLAIVALCAVLVLVVASPATCLVPRARVSSKAQDKGAAAPGCVNEEILNAMRDDQSAAASFCREFLPAVNVTVTQRDVCYPTLTLPVQKDRLLSMCADWV